MIRFANQANILCDSESKLVVISALFLKIGYYFKDSLPLDISTLLFITSNT